MAPPLMTLSGIHLTFGSTPLLEGCEFSVGARERLCLVGRNGSGKSTLLKVAAGLVEPDDGERFIKPGVTWRYLPQDPDLTAFDTVEDYILDGMQGADQAYRVPYLLEELGLTGREDPKTISGGEARRAALARTLAPEPDVLLLDEPTNHLDLPVIEWLEGELASMSSALVLISHDRRFLETLSRRTLWMDRGQTRNLDKGFGAFEDWRDALIEQEELDQHKLGRQIVREQHWVVHGVSGRRKRNVKRLKDLATLRAQHKSHKSVQGGVNATVVDANKSGKTVAKLKHVSKSFDGRKIVDDFSMLIGRGECIGIVGPNGSGKTTLLKLIMGSLEADAGSIELGVNLEPLIIDQKRESLNPDWTLSEALTDGGGDSVIVGDQSVHVIRYMKDFLFIPEQARTPVHILSGGERGRLQLARGLRLPSNLLVLDEPTNDLDLETLDLLQELVADYKGTVIVVSHDRDFLDRTVTRTIGYEGDGRWQVYAGGYTDMVNQRGEGVRARKIDKQAGKSKSGSTPQKSTSSEPTTSGKLSYKHKFRLESLPKEMAALEAKIKTLETAMADPDYFTRDPDGFMASSERLAETNDALEALEMEWLELEEMKAAAEG
ncbi:ABC-F family ATP-binding cassette domain-containing protein [Fretibacter rubidus]|uniref:ABC-F family ATP-binding cassette domain-containing protein n=1 Tax=Fretibacter rubidus TaxID=570162 RepID=UPI00352BB520